MTMIRPPAVMFRPGDLAAELDARGDNRNETARRDLTIYYALMDWELRDLDLTEPEALLLVDVLNGTAIEPTSVRYLWASVEDAARLDHVGPKWGVDTAALVERLKDLRPAQVAAIVDAVNRYWQAADDPDRLRTVGLVR